MFDAETYLCPVCEDDGDERRIDPDQGDYLFANRGEHEGAMIHYECAGLDYAATVVHYPAGSSKPEQVVFTDCYAMESEYGEEPFDWFLDLEFDTYWVRTDAWRGYTEFRYADGLIPIGLGWVTGYPDGSVAYKQTTVDLYEHVKEHGSPFDLWWCFAPTSNVFSTSSTLLIRERDEDLFEKWLLDIGFDRESVRQAFQ